MSSKQLTAKVRLDSTQAERRLDNLINKINRLNKLTNQVDNSKINSQLDAANKKVKEIDSTTKQVANTTSRLGSLFARVASLGTNIRSKVKEWLTNQKAITSATRSTNSALGSVWGKLKAIASTYLGVMGMRAVVQTSDTITAAENKLNYLNGGDAALTQESMDKMYTSAQKVRMSYTDMMANVSKSMTLAGDAFQGNLDNAIRFQEVMAEAYAIGGASAAEMHSSMYQMIQALGSGRLQGDELRSVREGAPLAYQKIEEFAQGVYNTTESLKDLASQGKITSDMVVAAIMSAGDQMDTAFAQTHQTFAQTWEQIKNVAKKSFEPVAHMMRDTLNNAVDDGLIDKLENVFTTISKVIQIVAKVVINAINWIADNWETVKNIIVAGLLVLAGMWIWQAGVAIVSFIATLMAMTPIQLALLVILVAILSLIYVFYLWKTGAIDTCHAITIAILIIGVVLTIVLSILTGGLVLIPLVIAVVLAAILAFFEEIMGGIYVVGAFFKNVGLSVANFFIAIWNWLGAVWHNFIALVVNLANACGNVLSGVFQNIGIWWNNICADMKTAFWDFVASCLEGVSELAPVIEAVASAFDKEISISGMAETARAKANAARTDRQDYVDIGAAWDAGMNTRTYQDVGDAWSSGINTYDTWQKGWVNEAYNNGYDTGAGVKNAINEWGSQFQSNGSENGSIIDNLGEKLGLNFKDMFGDDSTATGVGSGYDPNDAIRSLDDIEGNTGRMADSMDLTNEDLEYLRRIADMEWKKEYTTAEIKVEMNNNNQINSESDLDGIVTRLADKLYEEMNVVANGVYAY